MVWHCSVVAALGSGFAYSLVSQGLQGQPINAITTAAGFAVFQGIFFKASDHFGIVICYESCIISISSYPQLFCNSVGRKILETESWRPVLHKIKNHAVEARPTEVWEELQERTSNRSHFTITHRQVLSYYISSSSLCLFSNLRLTNDLSFFFFWMKVR